MISGASATQLNETWMEDESILNAENNDFTALASEIETAQNNEIKLTRDYAYNQDNDEKYAEGIPIKLIKGFRSRDDVHGTFCIVLRGNKRCR